jgi:hypothetical protein
VHLVEGVVDVGGRTVEEMGAGDNWNEAGGNLYKSQSYDAGGGGIGGVST